MRTERLTAIVALLRRHDRLTASQLAERLGVSRRTVLRDIDELSLSGVPIYTERGRGGGYALLPHHRPPPAHLTPQEIALIFMPGGASAAAALGRAAQYESARAKLEAQLPGNDARAAGSLEQWLVVAPHGWSEPEPPPPRVAELADACARRAEVDIEYAPLGRPSGSRRVQPLGLVLAGRVWYVVAEKPDDDVRTYRVDRVHSVNPTGALFTTERSVAAEWQRASLRFRSRSGLAVKVVAPAAVQALVRHLAPAFGRVTQPPSQEPSDHVTFEVICENLASATALAAALGRRAQVLGPPELAEALERHCTAVIEELHDRTAPSDAE